MVGVIGLLGYIYPFITVHLNLFGNTYLKEANGFTIFSLIRELDNQMNSLDIPQSDTFKFIGNNEIMGSAGKKLVATIGGYYLTILFIIMVMVCTAIGVLEKISSIVLVLSLFVYSYAGYTISRLPADLIHDMEEKLGFLSELVKISDVITIHLGVGYWITLGAIACMLVVRGISLVGRN